MVVTMIILLLFSIFKCLCINCNWIVKWVRGVEGHSRQIWLKIVESKVSSFFIITGKAFSLMPKAKQLCTMNLFGFFQSFECLYMCKCFGLQRSPPYLVWRVLCLYGGFVDLWKSNKPVALRSGICSWNTWVGLRGVCSHCFA